MWYCQVPSHFAVQMTKGSQNYLSLRNPAVPPDQVRIIAIQEITACFAYLGYVFAPLVFRDQLTCELAIQKKTSQRNHVCFLGLLFVFLLRLLAFPVRKGFQIPILG